MGKREWSMRIVLEQVRRTLVSQSGLAVTGGGHCADQRRVRADGGRYAAGSA